ncbi:MAG: hypothetical protein ACLQU4_19465 [Limisphaerales bacterium]
MDTPPPTQPAGKFRRHLLRKALTLAVVTVVFGWFYGWASPWAFPKSHTADFKYGVLHGALMPIALPTLLIGKDVPIYAPDNSGRGYKIGYICGINACGLLFFGLAFRRPTSTKSDKFQ